MSSPRPTRGPLLGFAAALLAVLLGGAPGPPVAAGGDPLPSWNEGRTKTAIREFVGRVTREGGSDFVAPEDRVATFDNDGTLWVEKPLPNELYFCLSRIRSLAAQKPEMREQQPFKAALEGDAAYFHEAGAKAVVELLAASHTGMTQEEFAGEARSFMETQRHPKLGVPYGEVTYRPMRELLAYLRANGFRTWLCSGGTQDFMRVFSRQLYDIPPEQVIGSEFRLKSELREGRLALLRLPEVDLLNDKEGKPVGISRHIGRRPLFVAGNVLSAGDVAMMEYSKGRRGPSFQLLVNHDDADREFAYQEKDNASLDTAKRYGFTVVSVKNDWKTVFGPAK